jgi:hypothetical protein
MDLRAAPRGRKRRRHRPDPQPPRRASPSAHDRTRNPHRIREAWNLRTVAAILANPRYTGRQVWNRQGIDHNESIPGDKRTSTGPVHRWNPRDEWVISNHRAHPPLISEADFIAAQTIDATHDPRTAAPAGTG